MARGRRPADPPPDPQMLFITAIPSVSLRRISEVYAGRRGCGVKNLQRRSVKEGWVAEREAYQRSLKQAILRRMLDEGSLDAVEACKEHVRIGREMWKVGAELLEKYATSDEQMDRAKALRVAIQLVSKGVEVERKGLGLADKVVRVVHAEELTAKFIEVIEQRLSAYPDLAADLIDGFREALVKEKEQIACGMDLETLH